MKVRLIGVVLVLVLLFLVMVIIVIGPNAAGSSEPLPSGSPSASPTVTPNPELASSELMVRALKAKGAAHRARRSLCRVRACFRALMPTQVRAVPRGAHLKATWEKALRTWRSQAKDWQKKSHAGRDKMLHPGGTSNGIRWLPLARWVGWPASSWSKLSQVIMRESSGRERAGEENGGFFRGLMQMWREHVAFRFWGLLYTAEYNLREACKLWLKEGWGPWAQTAY